MELGSVGMLCNLSVPELSGVIFRTKDLQVNLDQVSTV